MLFQHAQVYILTKFLESFGKDNWILWTLLQPFLGTLLELNGGNPSYILLLTINRDVKMAAHLELAQGTQGYRGPPDEKYGYIYG